MNPYVILTIVAAFVLNGFYWNAHGSTAADTRWTAKIQQQRADAEVKAREQEHNWQGAIDAIVTTQDKKLRATSDALDIALASLRSRPLRPIGPTAPAAATCPCGTGAGLCQQDAEFLAREAARANDIRTGLAACYAVIDEVK